MIKKLTHQLLAVTNSATAAEQEAWWLLEHVTGKSKAQLLLDCTLTPAQEQGLKRCLALRVQQQMPLPYILGTVPFGELTLQVRAPILIPRHETEEICEWVTAQYNNDATPHILDIGTGSGCIALSLAHALPNSSVIGIDINQKAIALATENKVVNKVSNVEFRLVDVFGVGKESGSPASSGGLESRIPAQGGKDKSLRKTSSRVGESNVNSVFNLIISNPPYVTEAEYTSLDPDVARWEDKGALVAEDSGLVFYKKIVSLVPNLLAASGMLVFEIGYLQGEAVAELMHSAGLTGVTVHQDSFGHDRWVVGKK